MTAVSMVPNYIHALQFTLDYTLFSNTVLYVFTLLLFAILSIDFAKSVTEMVRELSSTYMGMGGGGGILGGVLGLLVFTNATNIMEKVADTSGWSAFSNNYITQLVNFTPDDMISFFIWLGAMMLWISGLIVGIPGFISAFEIYTPGATARLPSSVMKMMITLVFLLSLGTIVTISPMPPLPSLLIQLFP